MRIVTVRQFPKRNELMLKRGYWAFGAACALCLACGLLLPADWAGRFGVLARPLELAARLPAIRSFAAASRVPAEIVSGFLGLLCWLSLAFTLYFAYWRCIGRREDGAENSERGLLALWSDEALRFAVPVSGGGIAAAVMWWSFLWRAMQAAPEAWRGPLRGDIVEAMLDDRVSLVIWGAVLTLPWATLANVIVLVGLCFPPVWLWALPPLPEALEPPPGRPAASIAAVLAELARLARTGVVERRAAFAATLQEGDMNKLRNLALLYAVARDHRPSRGIAWEMWRHAFKPWQEADQERRREEAGRRYKADLTQERRARVRRELRDWADKDAEVRTLHFAAIRASGDERALRLLADMHEVAKDRPEYRDLARQLFEEILMPAQLGKSAEELRTQGHRVLSALLVRQLREEWRVRRRPDEIRDPATIERDLRNWAEKDETLQRRLLVAIARSRDKKAMGDLLDLYEAADGRPEYQHLARQIYRHVLAPAASGQVQLALYRVEQSEERQARIRQDLRDWMDKDAKLRRMHLEAILFSEDEKAVARLADVREAAEDRPECRDLVEDIERLLLTPWLLRNKPADAPVAGEQAKPQR